MAFRIAHVEQKFLAPGPQPNGLQATPDGLWCIDQVDNKVYCQDYATGEVTFAVDTDTVHSSGITFGGGYLWIASTYECKIAKLDPKTGKTVAKYDSPGSGVVAWRHGAADAQTTGAHGLEWKDGKLYVASPPSQFVHVMDPESWTETHRFRTPGLRVHGLAWGDNGWLGGTTVGFGWLTPPMVRSVSVIPVTDGFLRSFGSKRRPKYMGSRSMRGCSGTAMPIRGRLGGYWWMGRTVRQWDGGTVGRWDSGTVRQ